MNNKKFTWVALATTSLAALGGITTASAQSADTLIDVLVDKGVITLDEARRLRQEADKDFTRAYAAKSGMPEWVTALKLGGDFRGRFEGFYGNNSDFPDRNRWRYRLRFGATALMMDHLEVGLRLASASNDPISRNQTLQDNASPKGIYLDLAYGKWYAINQPTVAGSFTFGKMNNPFAYSPLVFDGDYTPEGAAAQFTLHLNQDPVRAQSLDLNLGGFVLDEIGSSSSDPYLLGAQLRWHGRFGKEMAATGWDASAGIGFFTIQNASELTSSAVPDINVGNTRMSEDGQYVLAKHYNPLIADASIAYTLESFWMYNAAFPITLAGEYLYNPAVGTRNQGFDVGIQFGKSGKSRLWELSYHYRFLEADAWYEEVVDSDFGAFYADASAYGRKSDCLNGTNVRGHIASLKYSPANSLTLGFTAFVTELIDQPAVPNNKSDMVRIQADAQWKF